jgi:hypothetical protein
MNAILEKKQLPTVIGTPFEGGFFFDRILVDHRPHAIILAPKAEGEHPDVRWNAGMSRVSGALSFNDSFANTRAMAEAGSDVAKWARAARIGGFDDWCIAARDVKERLYRLAKPTTDSNWVYRHGENPSAMPATYPYSATAPAQTQIEAFRQGGPEAFDPVAYWTSTQYEGSDDYAWAQLFGYGDQGGCHKSNDCRVRLVRVIPI